MIAWAVVLHRFADAWTHTARVSEYVEFLWLLLWRVCTSGDPIGVRCGTAPPPLWKLDDEIVYTPIELATPDVATGQVLTKACSFDAHAAHRAALRRYFEASLLVGRLSKRPDKVLTAPEEHGDILAALLSPRASPSKIRKLMRRARGQLLEPGAGETAHTAPPTPSHGHGHGSMPMSMAPLPRRAEPWLPGGDGWDMRAPDLAVAQRQPPPAAVVAAEQHWRAGGYSVAWAATGFSGSGYRVAARGGKPALMKPRPPRTAPEAQFKTRVEGSHVRGRLWVEDANGSGGSRPGTSPGDHGVWGGMAPKQGGVVVVHMPQTGRPVPPTPPTSAGSSKRPMLIPVPPAVEAPAGGGASPLASFRSKKPPAGFTPPRRASGRMPPRVVNLWGQNGIELDDEAVLLLPGGVPPRVPPPAPPRIRTIRTHPLHANGLLGGLPCQRAADDVLRGAWLTRAPLALGSGRRVVVVAPEHEELLQTVVVAEAVEVPRLRDRRENVWAERPAEVVS